MNEEALLKFFGRWANLLDFWREFFDNFFLKLQSTGAAEGFEVFFWGGYNCLIVSGLWAKVTVFLQNFMAGC